MADMTINIIRCGSNLSIASISDDDSSPSNLTRISFAYEHSTGDGSDHSVVASNTSRIAALETGSADLKKHAETVSSFTSSGGRYYCDITHSFGASYTYIISDLQRYVTDTWLDANMGKELRPQTNDIMRLWFDSEPESIKVSLIGMGA